jgi:predicted nucleic acid-binding protein
MSAVRLTRTFIDTNILVYAEDGSVIAKQKRALELIKSHRVQRSGVVSTQVLQEYFVTVTNKLKLDPRIAQRKIEIFSKFDVAEPVVNDILSAIDLHLRHGFSFWDALILRMAKQAACSILLTEDLQHGQVIDGVEIVNPFI